MKRDVHPILNDQLASRMDQIRNIESVTYWYQTDDEQTRPVQRIGVIAQSLPAELQATLTKRPDSDAEGHVLGVSLGDWLGLITVGVKENDRRLLALEIEKQALMEVNRDLIARLASLESRLTGQSLAPRDP